GCACLVTTPIPEVLTYFRSPRRSQPVWELHLAISGVELISRWYDNAAYLAIMSDCAHTHIGVWSENSFDRTVVVADYG
ncbi:hypothetical protein ACP8V0_35285, partial [Mycolicibacterium nivoides]